MPCTESARLLLFSFLPVAAASPSPTSTVDELCAVERLLEEKVPECWTDGPPWPWTNNDFRLDPMTEAFRFGISLAWPLNATVFLLVSSFFSLSARSQNVASLKIGSGLRLLWHWYLKYFINLTCMQI
mmetsp:Transcript_2053/g.3788  ORF Transcript_2053/g.3788 Transcript_2053/m.3788 type:complete len:128 (+) Transcript_2053:492-875(+)